MFQRMRSLAVLAAALTLLLTVSTLLATAGDDSVTFDMVVSGPAQACQPNASATVKIKPAGNVDIMDVIVQGLPANTDFDFFVIQVPKTPFGVSWYQGDIVTDNHGRGRQQFVGRFNIETFAVAPGSALAPTVFNGDGSINPPFLPIHTYHLGLWFDSAAAAQAVGCPAPVTPFNGQHQAGIQVLNTSNFPDDHGPLRDVVP